MDAGKITDPYLKDWLRSENNMNISLLQVLNAPLFKNIKILSGKTGLDRIVKRASVFDAAI